MYAHEKKAPQKTKQSVRQSPFGNGSVSTLQQMAGQMGNQAMLAYLGQRSEPATAGKPLSDALREKFERKSGVPLDDVRVHYNSDQPEQLGAEAYAQGNEIFIGPGNEQDLEHELGHVVQQKQGLVKSTYIKNRTPISDDPRLERSAVCPSFSTPPLIAPPTEVVQLQFDRNPDTWKRPPWEEGKKDALWRKQIGMYKIDVPFYNPFTKMSEEVQQTLCPICHEPLSYQGAVIDHVIDWKNYVASKCPKDEAEFRAAYNDETNLVLEHASCNSSKGAKAFEEYAADNLQKKRKRTGGKAHESKMRARSIQSVLQELANMDIDDETAALFFDGLRSMLVEYNLTGDATDLDEQLELLDVKSEPKKKRPRNGDD